MTNDEARQWLDQRWREALDANVTELDPDVDQFIDSKTVSIRYALMTQMLGKIADESRSLLVLQKGSGDVGDWDARSFSTSVIVPWVADNHDVLGTSTEPYASKPLRRVRLTAEMTNVRDKAQWRRFVTFLEELDQASPHELQRMFRRCLASLARRLARQTFKYQIPKRVSLQALDGLLESFLKPASGGYRPLAVSAALLRTLGQAFSLFAEVQSQGLNEADSASGMPGDIMCHDKDGQIVLVVEVKDLDLTLADLRASTTKTAQADNLSNLLFAVPGIRRSNRDEIEDFVQRRWAAGLNIYQVGIRTLVRTSFVLLAEEWKVALLREIGDELDRRGDHAHRRAWHDLLSELTLGDAP